MDVTEQVIRQMIGTGGGSARPEYFSVNRSLNYSKGSNSLKNAETQRVTAIPYRTNYNDTVGLFGAENVFIKIQLDVQNSLQLDDNGIIIDTYEELVVKADVDTIYYTQAEADYSKDLLPIENSYLPAVFTNELTFVQRPLVKILLSNLKTGNKYIDAWFDVRLYKPNREEHPHDIMYINPKSFFYIGFHARNTKRLPYNVNMTVAGELISEFDLTKEQKRFLASSP